jgi:ATP-dependent DNA helicase RecG
MEKPAYLERAWQRIREEVSQGHQAYIVAPRIQAGSDDNADIDFLFGTESTDIASVEELAPRLHANELAGIKVAVLHGRLNSDEKDATMTAFAAGHIDVLISTTVIEVGVDVANATNMVIMDADRFGISQLHQLRGRVIRSEHQSYCYLFAEAKTDKTLDRLKALTKATNGFELAELDLELRGAGLLGGDKQWGITDLGMDAIKNIKMVEAARTEALTLVASDKDLALFPLLAQTLKEKNLEIHFE